ncbi:hypothetical protein M407DRAFT_20309 [Tulasnella calospora MUT 4182]|uniref:Uncharacterized protein n=1 Tax=Tulasnella calospora MUT 4182 TaxID=1051891 RepID=A0A0C3QRU5_9AGAM|nr:hypothetical protein M407DRAFT_20309 [Tulasnella calospora MUT 4182]
MHLGLPGPYYVRKAAGPNQKERVASAVWTISSPVKDVAGLGLTWPSGDNRDADSISEIRLDAVLHKDPDEVTGLHVHPYDFVTRASSYLDERHVVLVFKQISSLPLKSSWTGGPTMAQRH